MSTSVSCNSEKNIEVILGEFFSDFKSMDSTKLVTFF